MNHSASSRSEACVRNFEVLNHWHPVVASNRRDDMFTTMRVLVDEVLIGSAEMRIIIANSSICIHLCTATIKIFVWSPHGV